MKLEKNKIKNRILDNKKVRSTTRLIAYLIDAYIVTILGNIPILYYRALNVQTISIDTSLDGFTNKEMIILVLIGCIFSISYLFFSLKINGQTVGKKMLAIKVVSLDNQKLNTPQVIKRVLLGMIIVEGVLFNCSIMIHEVIIKVFNLNFDMFYLFAAITLVSIGYSFFNSDQQMFHDVIANTKVVKKGGDKTNN